MKFMEVIKDRIKKIPLFLKLYSSIQELIVFRKHNFNLDRCEILFVSYPKSGRTWLKVLIAKVFSLEYNLHDNLDEISDLHNYDSIIPKMHFFHLREKKRFKYFGDNMKKFKNKKIIFLIRDPRDVIVSFFHQRTKRNVSFKGSIHNFIRDEKYGIIPLLEYMNWWYDHKDHFDFMIVKYEDLHKNTTNELKRTLNFINYSNYSESNLKKSVEFAKFSKMKKMEEKKELNWSSMQPTDLNDKNAYKVRKGKVGSYKEELSDEDENYVNKMIQTHLNKKYNY